MPTLLDPKNDFVFKRLFVGAPHLLADLINAVRSDEAPVEIVQVLNPSIEPDELTGKFIVLAYPRRTGCARARNRPPWPAGSPTSSTGKRTPS